ncbi:MAG: DsrE family protein [Candidatus Levyibacteriota bacterium]
MTSYTLKRRTAIAAIAVGLASCLLVPATASAEGAKRDRVVMQVSDNDPAKWNLALNNAHNLQQNLGAKNVDVEIVAYGPGINMFKAESIVGNRIGDAKKAGVRFEACENTMQAMKLTKADMLDTVSYVPGGVIEIMRREQEGWAYIRP